jgi:hypothetical protein
MNNRLYLSVFLIALMCLAGWTAHAQLQRSSAPRQTWEYQEVELSAKEDAAPMLNRLGAQGWELVGVISACPSSPSTTIPCQFFAYMKRPR